MSEVQQTDIIIVGAGPVGMFAAFYAGLRELDVTVIESLASVGGQVANLYPQKQILDIAGFVGTNGRELIANLEMQMNQFQPEVKLNTTVLDVIANADGFEVQTNHGTWQAKAVLVATGKGAFEPRRLPAEIENDTPHIHYFLNDVADFTDRRVLVAGGGDSAVDMATLLATVASEVHLTHRRENFRAMERAVTELAASDVVLQTPYTIENIELQHDETLKVTLALVRSDEKQDIIVDDIMVNYGFLSENKIVAGWDIQPTVERQKFVVDQTMETSVPGVFAIGDVAGYPGKAELIATGFGEAPTAINSIMGRIYPDRATVLHSSGLVIENGKIKH
ncbi:MAG: NAD(P)/FAD-dependent oxidoreductase [Lactobacillaceae bacterium]|jgi:thioredoxin reductase (NADPH)|nr:NAD(P)/FAD-dependent oxidoreductase [Lactobacillaceae bacterium]